jgi:hypothetical protein
MHAAGRRAADSDGSAPPHWAASGAFGAARPAVAVDPAVADGLRARARDRG